MRNGKEFRQVYWVKPEDSAAATKMIDIKNELAEAWSRGQTGAKLRELLDRGSVRAAEGSKWLAQELDSRIVADGSDHIESRGAVYNEFRDWYMMTRRTAVFTAKTSRYAAYVVGQAFAAISSVFRGEHVDGANMFAEFAVDDANEQPVASAHTGQAPHEKPRPAEPLTDDEPVSFNPIHHASGQPITAESSEQEPLTFRVSDETYSEPFNDEDMADGTAEEYLNEHEEHKARFFEYINTPHGSQQFHRKLWEMVSHDFDEAEPRMFTPPYAQLASSGIGTQYDPNDVKIGTDEVGGRKYAYGYLLDANGDQVRVTREYTTKPGRESNDPANAVLAEVLSIQLSNGLRINPESINMNPERTVRKKGFVERLFGSFAG